MDIAQLLWINRNLKRRLFVSRDGSKQLINSLGEEVDSSFIGVDYIEIRGVEVDSAIAGEYTVNVFAGDERGRYDISGHEAKLILGRDWKTARDWGDVALMLGINEYFRERANAYFMGERHGLQPEIGIQRVYHGHRAAVSFFKIPPEQQQRLKVDLADKQVTKLIEFLAKRTKINSHSLK